MVKIRRASAWGVLVVGGLAGVPASVHAAAAPAKGVAAVTAGWSERRLREAREMTARGEFEAAARAYVEVWTVADSTDGFSMAKVRSIQGLKFVSAQDDAARQVARALRDRLAPDVSPDRLRSLGSFQPFRHVMRWFELNDLAGDDETLVAWARSVMPEPEGRRWAEAAFRLNDKLWNARAWPELAWLLEDGATAVARTDRTAKSIGRMAAHSPGAGGVALLAAAAIGTRGYMVIERGQIVAAFRGAGNEPEAQAALAAIRAVDPTPSALTGVVTVLIEAGLARAGDAALLDEAERGGLDVGVFRAALAEALRAPTASKR